MESINTIIKHPCVAPKAVLAVAAVALLSLSTAARAAMLAHWTFDEANGMECADASGHGYLASCAVSAGLGRVAGDFGNALGLSGAHLLSAPGGPDFSGVSRLTLSAPGFDGQPLKGTWYFRVTALNLAGDESPATPAVAVEFP